MHAPATDVVAAMEARASLMEALDDPLLLRICCAAMDATADGVEAQAQAQAQAQRVIIGAAAEDSDAWHPAHLARLACVSRCAHRACRVRKQRAVVK
jgi:hypothetical protein